MNDALVKKLRLAPDMKAAVLNAPEPVYLGELGLAAESGALAEGAEAAYDFVLLFVRSVAELNEQAPDAMKALKLDAMFWIAYPKGTSKIKTDINRDKGWQTVTGNGFEGVASIAVDDTWSALRFRPAGQVKSITRPMRTPDPDRAAGSRRAANLSDPGALTVPDDLAAALTAAPEAAAFFEKLAPYGRKEYIRWVNEAKRDETRANRVAASVDRLKQGIKAPHLKA